MTTEAKMDGTTWTVQEVSFTDKIGRVLAIVIPILMRRDYGLNFVTPDHSEQQVGLMHWPKGHVIPAHYHVPQDRHVTKTQEVLFVRHGSVLLELYTEDGDEVASYICRAGDVIVLLNGAHGFLILDDAELVEVKQGPYNPAVQEKVKL